MMLDAGLLPEKYARNRDVSMKMTAAAPVILPRKLVGPLDPKRVWEEPPPKTAPMSAPFPVCRRMMRIRARDTTMCRITITVYMAFFRFLRYRYLTMPANERAERLAPPTSAPSMSFWAINSAMFSGFTDPP
jgi:hypothetical protein